MLSLRSKNSKTGPGVWDIVFSPALMIDLGASGLEDEEVTLMESKNSALSHSYPRNSPCRLDSPVSPKLLFCPPFCWAYSFLLFKAIALATVSKPLLSGERSGHHLIHPHRVEEGPGVSDDAKGLRLLPSTLGKSDYGFT